MILFLDTSYIYSSDSESCMITTMKGDSRYDYLGGANETLNLAEHGKVHDLDITSKLKIIRKRTVFLAKQKNLCGIRALFLRHVFFMSPNQAESCLHQFNKIITK